MEKLDLKTILHDKTAYKTIMKQVAEEIQAEITTKALENNGHLPNEYAKTLEQLKDFQTALDLKVLKTEKSTQIAHTEGVCPDCEKEELKAKEGLRKRVVNHALCNDCKAETETELRVKASNECLCNDCKAETSGALRVKEKIDLKALTEQFKSTLKIDKKPMGTINDKVTSLISQPGTLGAKTTTTEEDLKLAHKAANAAHVPSPYRGLFFQD